MLGDGDDPVHRRQTSGTKSVQVTHGSGTIPVHPYLISYNIYLLSSSYLSVGGHIPGRVSVWA